MKKIIIAVILLLITIIGFNYFGLQKYLTFEYIKQNRELFAFYYQDNKILTLSVYFLLYIILIATSIPGSMLMAVLGGFLFGNLLGVILVSFASSIGATIAFLISRYFFSDLFKEKFSKAYKEINQGIEKEGIIYLISLRLMPIIPFWLVNLAMGLTKMRAILFYIVTQIATIPAIFILVNAGTHLSSINSLEEIFTFKIILSFTVLALFPFLFQMVLVLIKRKKF